MPGSLTFDPVLHEYRIDNQQIPSVSQVLRAAGLVDYSHVPKDGRLERAADKGTKVHRACELWDNGDLYQPTLSKELAPYVCAWRYFRQTHNFTILANEKQYWSELHGLRFGMTLDRLVLFDTDTRPTVIDIKTSREIEAWHAVQVAGYACGLEQVGTPAKRLALYRRMIVQLRDDASYRLGECDNFEDGEIFEAALRIAWWRGPKAWLTPPSAQVPEQQPA